jgi:hypothetical protein
MNSKVLSPLETPNEIKSREKIDVKNKDKISMKSPIAVASTSTLSPLQKSSSEDIKKKKYESYKDLDNLELEHLSNIDWLSLYPVITTNDAITNPVNIHQLSPRTAAKLYLDALFMIEKYNENPKYLQDRIPILSHKYYNKKKW